MCTDLPRPRFQTMRYRIKTKAVEAVGSLVAVMGKLNLAPSTSVLDVLERALLLVGKARADLCDARCAGKKVVVDGFPVNTQR